MYTFSIACVSKQSDNNDVILPHEENHGITFPSGPRLGLCLAYLRNSEEKP